MNKLGISTISMGWHPNHTLEDKLTAASEHGFAGVEIFWTDLTRYAERHGVSPIEVAPQSNSSIRQTGSGQKWIAIAHALGTDMIQIPSNDDRSCSGDEATMISELVQLADIGSAASPPIRFAYEALGWGTHVADWEESMRIVELVKKDNFGLCLDTYHILARLWADIRSEHGTRPGGTAALNASIKRFLEDYPVVRLFYIQLSDAERCQPQLLPGHEAYNPQKDPSHAWCTWGRLFPGETDKGAYLPMNGICRAMLEQKPWHGWVSMEIFHRTMKDLEADPNHWAKRGRASWDHLCSSLIT